MIADFTQRHAIAAYTFLADEGRRVAGLFFALDAGTLQPVQPVRRSDASLDVPAEKSTALADRTSLRKADL